MTDDDPLDGADIGETRYVTETKTLHGINFEPNAYYGDDRLVGDVSITNVEIVENDDGADEIRVTWAGDVTKRLPRNWDQARFPRTEEERTQQRRRTWARKALNAAGIVIPIAIVVPTAIVITNRVASQLTVNGQPVGPVELGEVLPTVAFVFIVAALIVWGLSGGLPGRVGGAR